MGDRARCRVRAGGPTDSGVGLEFAARRATAATKAPRRRAVESLDAQVHLRARAWPMRLTAELLRPRATVPADPSDLLRQPFVSRPIHPNHGGLFGRARPRPPPSEPPHSDLAASARLECSRPSTSMRRPSTSAQHSTRSLTTNPNGPPRPLDGFTLQAAAPRAQRSTARGATTSADPAHCQLVDGCRGLGVPHAERPKLRRRRARRRPRRDSPSSAWPG